MLISSYSKSPHFDPRHPDAHTPTSRDEVGLVRAIVVKVWIFTWSECNRCNVTHYGSGTLIFKAKRDMENYSD